MRWAHYIRAKTGDFALSYEELNFKAWILLLHITLLINKELRTVKWLLDL